MWTGDLRLRLMVAAAVFMVARGAGYAQDSRTVTEPKIPPVCVKLEAKLEARFARKMSRSLIRNGFRRRWMDVELVRRWSWLMPGRLAMRF